MRIIPDWSANTQLRYSFSELQAFQTTDQKIEERDVTKLFNNLPVSPDGELENIHITLISKAVMLLEPGGSWHRQGWKQQNPLAS